MELKINIKLTNGADSESAPIIVYSNFDYTKEVSDSTLYERIAIDILEILEKHSS